MRGEMEKYIRKSRAAKRENGNKKSLWDTRNNTTPKWEDGMNVSMDETKKKIRWWRRMDVRENTYYIPIRNYGDLHKRDSNKSRSCKRNQFISVKYFDV